MKTRRNSVPPSVRLKVLIRDGFRCVYCGATKENDRLEMDHVIPVSRGGTDDIGNLVTACRQCNIGKGSSEIVHVAESDDCVYVRQCSQVRLDGSGQLVAPVPNVALMNQAARTQGQVLEEWGSKLREKWDSVEFRRNSVMVSSFEEQRFFAPDFVCRGRANSDIAPAPCIIYVTCLPWKEVGAYEDYEQRLIKLAVVAGYETPSLIILGPPQAFMAFLIHTRHKGHPVGHMVDQHLEPWFEFMIDGWYPDENDDFVDLREAFRNNQRHLRFRGYEDCDDGDVNIVGVYCSYAGEAL